jgi:hypothetical protein
MSPASIRRGLGRTAVVAGALISVSGAAFTGFAAANTNFNGTCESSEACGYRLGGSNAWDASDGLYDYEGRDNYLNDNYFKASYASARVLVDDRITSVWNRGTSCQSVWRNGYNDTGSEYVISDPGGYIDLSGTSYDNSASSLVWWC